MRSVCTVGFLLAFCALLFFFRLGDRDLTSSHEARAAQNAQSILDNDCWLLPQLFNRQVELQKPPFYYWIVAWLACLMGGPVDGWTVRLPAALSATATVLAVYIFCAIRGRHVAGFLAATMLATCLHFTWLGRVARIDMPLTLTTTLTILCFFTGRVGRAGGLIPPGQPPRRRGWRLVGIRWGCFFAGYALLGIGFLFKGPIALALPAAVAVALFTSNLMRMRRSSKGRIRNPSYLGNLFARGVHQFGLCWGLPLTACIALPWIIAVNQSTNGDLFQMFFWHHNVARGFGGADELASYPFWYYVPRFLIDLLPWSLLVGPAVWFFFRNKISRTHDLAWLGFAWFTGMFALLSCMSFKRADYLLPAYPGAALFLGCVLERMWQSSTAVAQQPNLRLRFAPAAWLAIVCAFLIGWTVYTEITSGGQSERSQLRRLAREIRRQDDGPVILFRTEAHDLAHQIGPPLVSLVEWQNLDAWAAKRRPVFVVMPHREALGARGKLRCGGLIKIAKTAIHANSRHELTLVQIHSEINNNRR